MRMLKQSQTKRGHRGALEMHRACPLRLPSSPHFSPSVPTSLHRSGFSDVCHRLDSLLPLSLVSMHLAVPCAVFIGLGGFLFSAGRGLPYFPKTGWRGYRQAPDLLSCRETSYPPSESQTTGLNDACRGDLSPRTEAVGEGARMAR